MNFTTGSTRRFDTNITATSLGITGSSARTFAVWIYPTTSSGRRIFEYGTSVLIGNSFSVRVQSSTVIRVTSNLLTNVDAAISGINTWIHLAVVYDGSVINVYINGVVVTSTSRSFNTTNTDLFIGSSTTGTNTFGGRMYDFRVYNRALSSGEIETIYYGDGYDGIVQSLVGRWLCTQWKNGEILSNSDLLSAWNGNSGSTTGSQSATAGTNRCMIVFTSTEISGTVPNVTGITYGGQPLTHAATAEITGGISGGTIASHIECWYILDDGIAAAGSTTISVTWSSATGDLQLIWAIFDNVSQTAPIKQSVTASIINSSTVVLPTLTAGPGDSIIIGSQVGDTTSFNTISGYINADTETGGSSTANTHYLTTAAGTVSTPTVSTNAAPTFRITSIGIVLGGMSEVVDLSTNRANIAPTNGGTVIEGLISI